MSSLSASFIMFGQVIYHLLRSPEVDYMTSASMRDNVIINKLLNVRSDLPGMPIFLSLQSTRVTYAAVVQSCWMFFYSIQLRLASGIRPDCGSSMTTFRVFFFFFYVMCPKLDRG
jgi:hypothetical protein